MANLTEHMMINKWDDEIGSAITHVGGDTYGSEGLPDYAEIIRSQLVANDAVGKGIYQDFLYVNQDNQTSIYPWEGEPTTSTNAPQSTVIASVIKNLYDVMATTERYTVLLVDKFPTEEINLSAIYLVKAQCDCEECGEGCNCKENTYIGCYYVKRGHDIIRIDIPEFKYDLNELFYLTRAEYDASLSDYVKEIEDLLRKKFGKYWDDEGFTLDTAVEEIKKDLEEVSKQIVADTNAKLEEALNTVDETILGAETRLNEKFNDLSEEINTNINELQQDIKEIDQRVTVAESNIEEKFDELNSTFNTLKEEVYVHIDENFNEIKTDIDTEIANLDTRVSASEKKVSDIENNISQKFNELDTKFEDLEIDIKEDIKENFDILKSEVNTNISNIDNKVSIIENKVDKVVDDVVGLTSRIDIAEKKIDDKFIELDTKFNNFSDQLESEINTKFDEQQNIIEEEIDKIDKKVDSNFDSMMNSLQDYVKKEDLIAIDTEIGELK